MPQDLIDHTLIHAVASKVRGQTVAKDVPAPENLPLTASEGSSEELGNQPQGNGPILNSKRQLAVILVGTPEQLDFMRQDLVDRYDALCLGDCRIRFSLPDNETV